ncbi:Polysaccharide deacetylase [Candidatus Methylocalor cossyra]|uniref:Polysaccharide deacetylase n=2 Tax=Candidatus Methylocalor cossyra TaxID=3108543 RepID=A0ABM9NFY1_9GAMM
MTVDVEDYFHVSAFAPYVERHTWDRLPCRVERNTERILDIFAYRQVRATFFVLGWVAERYPSLVRRIVDAGHELACHGYSHIRVTEQTPDQFREDAGRAKALLEDIAGCPVLGYRAATYSIGAKTLWALPILEELGFRYSSSIYPVRHDLYGMPEAPRFAFRPMGTRSLLEIPITTVRWGKRNYPCGGGGYFRLLPYQVSRWAMARVNRSDGQACIFYFHPWELDPDQPRQRGIGLKARFRHYFNLSRMERRLQRLLSDFQWDTMAKVFLAHHDTSPSDCQ